MPLVSDRAAKTTAGPVARPATPDALARNYLCNLKSLYARNQTLAARLEALPFAACPELEPARDGSFTAKLTADSGKPVYLHSRYRPAEEARQFIAGQIATRPNAGEPGGPGAEADNATFLVAGLGLGYQVAELLRQPETARVVVAEDDLALIKAALCISDISDALLAGRVLFLTSADKATVHEVLRPANADIMLGLRVITLPHSVHYHAEFHARIRAQLQDYIAFARLQMVTVLRNARVTCKNILFNLPAYLGGPGVEVLPGRGAGLPAILVAAGPSLARNIDQLAGLRERAVIIAVQTVFKHLLARGIRPHFVTSLDFHEISAQFFHDVEDFGDCILVAEPKATWHVLDAYRGRAHVLHNDLCDVLLQAAAPPRGRIRPGSTVAHLSFYLAEYLGCDPIILVGQDLSFSDGLYYPPGMPIEQTWQPELGRFCTLEMKQWERIARARPILRKVVDIRGRETYTDEQLFTYAEQFQTDFAAARARVINASEGGMRLQGTEVMNLAVAAQQFCTRPVPAPLLDARPQSHAADLRGHACEALTRRLAEIGEVHEIAVEMRGLLADLANLVERPAEFNRLVARVDELRARICHYERIYRVVVGVSQLAELRRYSADRRMGEQTSETAATARRRLQRDQEFVKAFVEGCEYLQEILPQAIQRLEGGSE